jgi:hypothetical protein
MTRKIFLTRERPDVTTAGAVRLTQLRVDPCDSAPVRYSFGTDDFFSDDGPELHLRNEEHVELGWFTPLEARELKVADPAYLELFGRTDALQRGRR